MATNYPAWQATRSNEEFDRAQHLACELTDEDRAAGRPAPQYGYSAEAFQRAEKIVTAANIWHRARTPPALPARPRKGRAFGGSTR